MSPTLNGRAWRIECQNASGVWPDSVRPLASVIVPEIISGSAEPEPLEQLVDGEDRRLRVERVEDRLDDEEVHATLDQPVGRLAVGGDELVEPDVPGTGVGDVRRDRRGPVRRSDRPADVARAAGLARLERIGGLPGEPGRGDVHLADDALEAVVGLGDRRSRVNVFVSTMSAPASRYASWIARTMSGRVSDEEVVVAAQVARVVARSARRGSRPRTARSVWTIVPIAPSMTRIRSRVSGPRRASRPVRVKGGAIGSAILSLGSAVAVIGSGPSRRPSCARGSTGVNGPDAPRVYPSPPDPGPPRGPTALSA